MFDFVESYNSPSLTSFVDKRLASRYEKTDYLLQRGQSCVLNKVSTSRAERKGSYDFFSNDRVSEQQLKAKNYEQLASHCVKNQNLIVLQDTSEYNFASNTNRLRNIDQLGTLSNEYGLGFMSHISMVMDESDKSILGLSDLQLWHRKTDRAGASTRKQRVFEDKETYKWYLGIHNSHTRLKEANRITYVQDRDGDIYESIVKVKATQGAELLVRSCRDRRILINDSDYAMLYPYLKEQPILFSYDLKVKGDRRKNRTSRIAKLDVRCSKVKLVCPQMLQKRTDPIVEMYAIWVRENEETVPLGQTPIDWKLLTSHEVEDDVEYIKQVIDWYVSRWKIEEFFLSPKQEAMIWRMLYWKRVKAYAN